MTGTAPAPGPRSSLADWLEHLETLHPDAIELGLSRVARVWQRLHDPQHRPRVITIAGTNGKGSCAAALEAMLIAGRHRCGVYTSPHILRFNERARVDGRMLEDAELCAAFEAVEAVRDGVPLTFFEFTTLAALHAFSSQALDVWVLEVGLGGRLDAVNIIDADVAVITSIGLDHQQWLGETRGEIAREKAGIARPGKPVVCADPEPPPELRETVEQIGAAWHACGADSLPPSLTLDPSLVASNIAAAHRAMELLGLGLDEPSLAAAIAALHVPGRRQFLPGPPPVILDVAHNPQATAALAAFLRERPVPGRTIAACGMLADKAHVETLAPLLELVERWELGRLPGPRGGDPEVLAEALGGGAEACVHATIEAAIAAGKAAVTDDDRLVVFGSFLTVEAYLRHG